MTFPNRLAISWRIWGCWVGINDAVDNSQRSILAAESTIPADRMTARVFIFRTVETEQVIIRKNPHLWRKYPDFMGIASYVLLVTPTGLEPVTN